MAVEYKLILSWSRDFESVFWVSCEVWALVFKSGVCVLQVHCYFLSSYILSSVVYLSSVPQSLPHVWLVPLYPVSVFLFVCVKLVCLSVGFLFYFDSPSSFSFTSHIRPLWLVSAVFPPVPSSILICYLYILPASFSLCSLLCFHSSPHSLCFVSLLPVCIFCLAGKYKEEIKEAGGPIYAIVSLVRLMFPLK